MGIRHLFRDLRQDDSFAAMAQMIQRLEQDSWRLIGCVAVSGGEIWIIGRTEEEPPLVYYSDGEEDEPGEDAFSWPLPPFPDGRSSP